MGIYSALEDKWYSTLEIIDKVIPITKLTDKIDSKFPSFGLFLIIIFILLAGFVFLNMEEFNNSANYEAQLTVLSKIGLPLSGVNVELYGECNENFETAKGVTNSEGKVILDVCSNIQNITLNKVGYNTYRKEIDIETDTVFKLSANAPKINSITVLVKDEQANLLNNATVDFVCDSNITTFENQSSQGFLINIPLDCQLTQLRASAPGYKEKTKTLMDTDERIIIQLEKEVVEGKVIFETKTPTTEEPYVEIRITDSQNKSFTEITDGSGTKEATFEAGDYTYNAFSQKGEVIDGTFSVFANATERVNILFTDNVVESKKAIYVKIVDQLENPVTNAKISIYKDGNSFSSRNTNALGETSPITIDPDTLPLGTKFSGVIKAPEYETKFVDLEIVDKSGSPQKIVINQGGATLKVNHLDDISQKVKDAFTTLYYNGFSGVFDSGTSDTNGEVLFKNLPEGTYTLKSVYTKTDSQGEEATTLVQNGSGEVTIVLVTGLGKMKFNFLNQVSAKIDTNYDFYENIGGQMQKADSGESTRNYYYTDNIKSRTKVKLNTTNPEYFPHETITYQMSRKTQNKEVFLRELNSLPNTEKVQMFLVGVYNTNPLTENVVPASRITSGGTYYLYFDIILNNENTDYLLGDFKIGDNNYLDGSISIENAYSIDGYTRIMTQNSTGMIIENQSTNLVDANAVQANINLQNQSGKKSIPVFLEIKVDENALAEERIPLYFQARHGNEISLQYAKEIIVGESICMFGFDTDCPAFLLSHYLKWNNNDYVPLKDNHILLIGDTYKIKTTVKNLTDEDVGSATLNLTVPKDKLAYYTVGNDTNQKIHSINLVPFGTTPGNETEINLIKKKKSGRINLAIEKIVGGINALADYELNEDQISVKIVEKEELAIEIVPNKIYQDSTYPFFYVKTKYKSQYKGTTAIWYVEKNGERLGSGYEGQTDTNGIEIVSFDATPFNAGDALTFVAEDLNGNIPARLDVTVQDPFPPAQAIEPSCLKLKLPNGTFANAIDIPNFDIDVNNSKHIIVVSECTDTRIVYLYTDQYVSENNFSVEAGEEKDITVTGTARNGIYGAYPLQLLEIGPSKYNLISHIDIIVGGNSKFSLDDAILDFRSANTVTTKVVNKNFAGRKDIYNPQANISTNSVSLAYNKQGVPEKVTVTAKVVSSAIEAGIVGYGWGGIVHQQTSGTSCNPVVLPGIPTQLYFVEEAANSCASFIDRTSSETVSAKPEPDIPATNPSIPFYDLPYADQQQIISQTVPASGPSGIITTSAESKTNVKASFEETTPTELEEPAPSKSEHTESEINDGTPETWSMTNMGTGFTRTADSTVSWQYYPPTGGALTSIQDCYDKEHDVPWVAASIPSSKPCAYGECWEGGSENQFGKMELLSLGPRCNTCSIYNYEGTGAGIEFLVHTRGNTRRCGFMGWYVCDETGALKVQPEFYRIFLMKKERKDVWEEDFNIIPIEGKVYRLGSYQGSPLPEWGDVSTIGLFGHKVGQTWMEGSVMKTAVCAEGLGIVPPEEAGGGKGAFNMGDYAHPWIEYDPSGYVKNELVEVPSNMRMFLKNGEVFAEYIGTNEVASNDIEMTFTNKDLQGNQYALIEIQDWTGNQKEKMYFQVKLVGNEHNCFAKDGTEGMTGINYVPKLLFNWDWNNISYNQCDSENANYTYCDGVQFNISLIKRLQAIEQLLLEGKFNDIPKKTAFYTYLIKDNYSQELLDDFVEYYSGSFLEAGTMFGKFKKFIENEKLNYEVKLDSGTGTLLEYGGLYRVEIDIVRTNENLYSLFDGDNLNATIQIIFRPIRPAQNYNPFYETPFDGDIGSQRQGYGTSVDTNGLKLNNSIVADNKGASAMAQVGFETSTNLATLNEEVVLKYDGDMQLLEFYPAQPTPVEATITGSAGTVTVTYDVEGTNATSLPAKQWTLVNSTIGGVKCHDFTDNEVTQVNETVTGSTHELGWDGIKSGTIGLTTTFFTPKMMEETLRITPKQGNIMINSYAGLLGAGSIFLNNYYLRGATNYDTLDGIFDMIKEEKMCISKQADSEVKIFWNPDYLDELTDSIQTGGKNSC